MQVEWTCPNCRSEWIGDALECEQALIECMKCEAVFDIEIEVSVASITEVEEDGTH